MAVTAADIFSRIVVIDALPEGGRTCRIEADADERRRLARWLGVEAVRHLSAEALIEGTKGGSEVKVQGRLAGEFVQRCVVSLQPLVVPLNIGFERLYSPSVKDEWEAYGEGTEEIFLDLEEDPVIEPLPAEGIDLGAIVTEEVVLNLDAYPRAAEAEAVLSGNGAEGLVVGFDKGGEAGRQQPFAGLAARLSKP